MKFDEDEEKYIDFESYQDARYFIDMPPKKIEEIDVRFIKPLTKQFSSYLWDKYVSGKNRHPMLLEKDEFAYLQCEDYNWQVDWNTGNYDRFKDYLLKRVSFRSKDIVYFFWMKEYCIETTWEVFLKYWISFLFDDESPFLMSENVLDVVSFGPTGSLFTGKRKV